jgi:fucose permease
MAKNKPGFALCFGVLAFLGIYLGAFQRILNEMGSALSLSKVHMGIAVAAHFFGLLAGPLIAGELSDRIGRRIVILTAFGFFLAGNVTVFAFGSVTMVMAGIFLTGAGFGVLESGMSVLITDMAGENVNRLLNVSQVFMGFGAVTGPFLAISAVSLANGWKLMFGVSTLLALVLLLVFKKHPYPDHKINEKIEGTITLMLLKRKVFLVLCLSMVLYVGVEEGLAFWIATYAKEKGMSVLYATIILSIFWSGTVVGRYFISKFETRLNEIIIFSCSFTVVFLIAGVLSGSAAFSIIAFFFTGLGLAGIWPVIMALVKSYFPDHTGTAFGIMMSCCAVGGITIPFIMSYIAQEINLRWAILSCVIPLLLITANHIYLGFIKHSKVFQHF